MSRTLIVGYGNPDREDDGAAWHILCRLARHLNRPVPSSLQEAFLPDGSEPDLLYVLQLTPELSETLAEYDRICFVDAHTGTISEDLHIEVVAPLFQASPFSHHVSPAACLFFAQTLYHSNPQAVFISVKGYSFQFSNTLSEKTSHLVDEALIWIQNWLNNPQ